VLVVQVRQKPAPTPAPFFQTARQGKSAAADPARQRRLGASRGAAAVRGMGTSPRAVPFILPVGRTVDRALPREVGCVQGAGPLESCTARHAARTPGWHARRCTQAQRRAQSAASGRRTTQVFLAALAWRDLPAQVARELAELLLILLLPPRMPPVVHDVPVHGRTTHQHVCWSVFFASYSLSPRFVSEPLKKKNN
jgi:hypothetical protein